MLRLALIAATLLASGCAARPLAVAAPAALMQAQGQQRLGTFTSGQEGFDTHSFWLDTGKEVVVFDAQFTPALAQQLIARIRATTRSPITTLVITHPNPDKFNGAPAFQAIGARVVASEATAAAIPGVHAYKKRYFVEVAKQFTAESYPAEAHVDRTFKDHLTLPGGIELRVLAHAGVASTQTVAYLSGARALIVGDLVHERAHAWLEGGIVAGSPRLDVDGWVAALDELRSYPGATVYGGRGEPAPVGQAVADQQAYLRAVRALTRAYLQGLGTPQDALEPEHQQAIAARIAAAFPTYQLPYMTRYSLYGLITAELAR